MKSTDWRRTLATFLGVAVCLVLLGGQGCFSPKIASRSFLCTEKCPDGFKCINGFCDDGRGGGGGGGAGGAAGGGGTCANPVTPLCSAPAGGPTCDPVCQTGCPCGQRCSLTPTGVACKGQSGKKKVGEICVPGSEECAPGSVCREELCTAKGRCYRLCRDSDSTVCGDNLFCGLMIKTDAAMFANLKACNLSNQVPDCNPVDQVGCPDPALVCYLTGAGTTVCDCPGGDNRPDGARCDYFGQCAAGLACQDSIAKGITCQQTCKMGSSCLDGTPCMAGRDPTTPAVPYGWCP